MKPQSDRTADASAGIRLERYAQELYCFLLRRLRQRQEADDLLQAVYLRFLQTPHTELVRQPRAYLYRIATNLIGEFNLRLRREVVVFDSDTAMGSADVLSSENYAARDGVEDLELQEEVERVVGQLPKAYRTVLLMRLLEGLSFTEIGKRCGITEQSARKYLVRAMAQCRASQWKGKGKG